MSKELPSRELADSILRKYFGRYVSDSLSFVDVEKRLIDAAKYMDPDSDEFNSFVDGMQELWRLLIEDFMKEPDYRGFSVINRKDELRTVSGMHDILMAGLRLAQH